MTMLVTPKVALTLNNPAAQWSAKSVNIPNAKAKEALGDEWVMVAEAAKMLGVTLADDDYTFSNYAAKGGERQLSSPKVAMSDDKVSLLWGSQAVPLADLKARKDIEIGFETNKAGVVFNVTEVLPDGADDDQEPMSFDYPIVADKEGLGDDPVKVLKAALRTGKWAYKDSDGNDKPLIKAVGGDWVSLSEYEGQSLTVIGLAPKDAFKRKLICMDASGKTITLNGNTATENALDSYLTLVPDGQPFTKEEPGTLLVGEGRVVPSTGKTTYKTTLICPKASKGIPTFSM